MTLLPARVLSLLMISGVPAHADPEVEEGTILELKDPHTGERTMGYAYEMELAPAVTPRRVVPPRNPWRTQGENSEPVICWLEFSPRPNGLPGPIDLKDGCPAPFSRIARRTARRFRFESYTATGAAPVYIYRMAFGESSDSE